MHRESSCQHITWGKNEEGGGVGEGGGGRERQRERNLGLGDRSGVAGLQDLLLKGEFEFAVLRR